MKFFAQRSAVVLLSAALLAGCNDAEPPVVDEAAPVTESSAATDVPIRLASWEEVERIVAENEGKVVVLDVWSTWCTPCVREFPNLVDLHEKYGDQVACISLNCNYTGAEGETPEDALPEIKAFLQDQGATFLNVISTTPDIELFEALDVAAVPVVRVYDKQGELRQQFDNDEGEYGDEGFTYEQHIEPLVEELLKE